jgi:sulfur carrier protein ThiS adenylyltransferase
MEGGAMRVNERDVPWEPGLTAEALRRREKPDADILIRNGFPLPEGEWAETRLEESDAVVLIRRGETPTAGELRHLLAARHTPGVADRLLSARVGIAGAGGLGSTAAHALGRIGVGHLVIADHDVVEPSNLNRQLYAVEQIGRSKAEALAEDLRRANPLVGADARVMRLTPENAAETYRDCAVVLECLDDAAAKAMLVGAVLEGCPGAQVVAASGVAGLGPGEAVRLRRAGRRLWVVGDGVTGAAPGVGLMAPRVMLAAAHQALAAVRLLLGEDPCSNSS